MNTGTASEVIFNLISDFSDDKNKVKSVLESMNSSVLNNFWCYITKNPVIPEKNVTVKDVLNILYS